MGRARSRLHARCGRLLTTALVASMALRGVVARAELPAVEVEPPPFETVTPDSTGPAWSDAELAARIEALRAEREATRLAGPIVGTTLGALVFWAGLQTASAAQLGCRGIGLTGGYDCSDDTIWALTAGAGAALVAGAITVAIVGPRLSKRLARRRALTHEIRALELEREARDASGAVKVEPTLGWRLAITGERQGLALVIRF